MPFAFPNDVLSSVYLVISESHESPEDELLVRAELCDEAWRLGALLIDRPACTGRKSHALVVLMCFQLARLGTRMFEVESVGRPQFQAVSRARRVDLGRELE